MLRALVLLLLAVITASQGFVTELAAGHKPYPFGYYGPYHRYPFAYRYYSFRPRTYPLHQWSYPYGASLLGPHSAYAWVDDALPAESETLRISNRELEVAPRGLKRMANPVNDPFGW